ncbi:hypothetical protein DM02DRAFT_668353 [Periconia macrospinosa]|uniref:Uncharacterized protein n=1 Tax=Periconia macrospinosa TaxID=97972 RepID=A0A2V1E4M0_9PLEO|nr:hypothetical protein DM02DRAFT_668353 [Periconia macrospinosa]
MAKTPPSKLQRALPASLFLALGATAFYLMDITTLFLNYDPPSAKGFISHGNTGIKTQILQKFHWIGFLDEVFRDVTVGFAPTSLGFDLISRWQMINFMLDIGIMYFIHAFEGLRGNAGFPVSTPAFFATLAQLGGGGVIVPMYYFFNIVFGVSAKDAKSTADARKINIPRAWIYTIGILLFHYVPTAYLFNAPSMDERHWWAWAWQLYPARIAIFYYIVRAIGSVIPLPLPTSQPKSKTDYQKHLLWMLSPFLLLSAAMWSYTLFTCPYPFSTVFWAQPLSDANVFNAATWNERMRRTLIFDQWFLSGSTLLWLMWSVKNVKQAVVLALQMVVLTVIVGPGAAMGILWWVRERKTVG